MKIDWNGPLTIGDPTFVETDFYAFICCGIDAGGACVYPLAQIFLDDELRGGVDWKGFVSCSNPAHRERTVERRREARSSR